MASTYVNDLRLEEIGTGDQSGTWGTTTNTNLELIGEALGYGTQDCFSSDADATTTVADGATDPARSMYFKVTSSATLSATRTLTIAPNTVSRVMFIENATTGSQSITISQGSGANVTIATGKTAVVYLDGAGSGAAVVDAMALVDPGVTDTLAEVLTAGNTSSGTNIELTTTDKVQFRDSAIYINSSADGQLDIVADTEVQIATTTVDLNGALDVSGAITTGGNLTVNGADVTITANIIHSGDTNTFFGFPSDDTFRVVTANTEALRVNSSQNVGIGTASPDSTLHVHAASAGSVTALSGTNLTVEGNANNYLSLLSPDANLSALVYGSPSSTNNASINSSYNSGSPYLNFNTGGSEAMRIDSNSKLLIGDSASHTSDLLQIETPASGGGHGIQIRRNDANGDQTIGTISFGNNTDTDLARISAKTDGDGNSGDSGALLFSTQVTSGALTERMRVDSSGNVNIGRQSTLNAGQASILAAASKQALTLQVTSDGNSLVQGFDSSGNLEFQVTGGGAVSTGGQLSIATTGVGNSLGSFLNQGTGANFYEASDGTKTMIAGTDGSQTFVKIGSLSNHPVGLVTNNTERVSIDTSGNVGIGTSSDLNDQLTVGSSTDAFTAKVSGAVTTMRLGGHASTAAAGRFDYNRSTGFLTYKEGFYDSEGDALLTVTNAGNVGIGDSSPSQALVVSRSSGSTYLDIGRSTQGQGQVALQFNGGTGGVNWIIYQDTSSDNLSFFGNSSNRMTLDSSGNLMVGQTTGTIYNQTSETGLTVAGSGSVQATTSAGTTLFLNRLSSDGQIVGFYKDGAQVGSIGTTAGDIQIGSGDTALRFQASTDSVFPAQASGGGRGSAIDLGLDSVPFKDLYLSGDTFVGEPSTIGAGETGVTVRGLGQIRVGRSGTSSATLISFNNGNGEVGTITTSGSATAYNTSSDQRLKENIVDAPSASDDIDAIQVRSFDWKADGSHQKYGMIAQELQTVAPEAVSQPEDPEEMMGVDYSKLVPIMLKEIQQLRARVAQLEGAN